SAELRARLHRRDEGAVGNRTRSHQVDGLDDLQAETSEAERHPAPPPDAGGCDERERSSTPHGEGPGWRRGPAGRTSRSVTPGLRIAVTRASSSWTLRHWRHASAVATASARAAPAARRAALSRRQAGAPGSL